MLVENPEDKKAQDAEFSLPSSISQPVLANPFMRWLAGVINSQLLVVMFFIASSLSFGVISSLSIILYIGLQIYFMKTYRQTMAKRWLGLRVLDNKTLQPIDFTKYIYRELIDLLFIWTRILIIISAIVLMVRRDHRSLADLIIGSVVVKDGQK